MNATPIREQALSWLDYLDTGKPSSNTTDARISDLANIGARFPGAPPLEMIRNGRLKLPGTGRDKLVTLDPFTLDDLTVDNLRTAFGAYATDHANATIRRAHSTWTQFLQWLVDEGELDVDLMRRVTRPKAERSAPKAIRDEVVTAVHEQVGTERKAARTQWPELEAAVFLVLLTTGARVGEVIDAKVANAYLDGDNPRLEVTGKGRKTRPLRLVPETAAAIRTYLADRHTRDLRSDHKAPLFMRSNGEPMTRSSVTYMVQMWFRQAGRESPKGALIHAFRHTFATNAAGSGKVTAAQLQAALGHESLATSQRYIDALGFESGTAFDENPVRNLISSEAPAD